LVYIFATDSIWVYLHSAFTAGSKRRIFSAIECVWPFKVI